MKSPSIAALAITLVVALFGALALFSHSQMRVQQNNSASGSSSSVRRYLSSLVIVGDNGSPRDKFPLGKCEGDCDRDSDCEGNLVCFQRSGTQSVPGCSGSGSSGKDYCVEPSSGGGGSSGGGFELKMYWEDGYYWQEETRERKWCMRCDSSRPECSAGRKIYITDCDRTTSKFEFVSAGGATLVKIASSNLCLRGSSSAITAETCNSGDSRQRWIFSSSSSRFQLRPEYSRGSCISQSHHPKEGELLSLWDCRIPESDDTSYWVKY